MTTYIMLLNWTETGVKNVRESPRRLDAARKQLADMGGSFKAFYMTMGEHDMVAVCEAPDDAVALSMTTESGPCFFAQKGPQLSVLSGTPVSARSGEAGQGCTA